MKINWIIAFFWFIFLAYWIYSARGIKKDIRVKGQFWQGMGARLLIGYIALVIIGNTPFFIGILNRLPQRLVTPSFTAGVIGAIVMAIGIAFAIWARRHLGRNWSPQPAMKEDHELVTSGPYRFVRHPIYTGILLAFIGSAIALGAAWGIVLLGMSIVFIYRVKTEDEIMLKLFPDTYPAYKAKTKAIIPFVL